MKNPVEHNRNSETAPVRPPRRPLTPWVFVLPGVLLLGLLFASQQSPKPPAVPDLLPIPTPRFLPTPATISTPNPVASATPQESKAKSSYTLYVPGSDAKLHERLVPVNEPITKPTPAQFETWYNQQANQALALLFKEHNIFPPGTTTPQASLKNDVVSLHLNKTFGDSKLWKSETITQLAVYSLVNTLLSPGLQRDGKPKGVLLLIDNHPITNLGEFDASDPIEPNMQLVAKS